MNKLSQAWDNMKSSFWFIPSLIVASSIFLAMMLISGESAKNAQWVDVWPRLFGASAEGSRAILSAIAGSMITVLGVTFSMTLVTLALASSQYTSRILRNFMRDRVTQVVLGVFGGIFTYSLIVLRVIRGGGEGEFVPRLAVFFAVVLAIGSIGILIFFIHHIASLIQASSIIGSVSKETLAAIDLKFPQKQGQEEAENDENKPPRLPPNQAWQSVLSSKNGYIQSVDETGLLTLAGENNMIIRMERRIGDFVVQNTILASIMLSAPPEKKIISSVRRACSIDRYRTVNQDPAFGIRQIVDMALRALSPGVIDNATAVMCVDYLTAILGRLSTRDFPSSFLYEGKELRVILKRRTFSGLVSDSFDQIRRSSNGQVGVILKLFGGLQIIAGLTVSPARRAVLLDQVEKITEEAQRTVKSPYDREKCEKRIARVHDALKAG